MEADGSGANAIVATGMYTGKLGKQVFDGPEWASADQRPALLRSSKQG